MRSVVRHPLWQNRAYSTCPSCLPSALEKTEQKRILRLAEHGSSPESVPPVPALAEAFEEPDPPEATTVEPEAAAIQSEAAAVEPEATAIEPEATAIEPEATAVEPEATAVEPEAIAIEPEATAIQPEPNPVEPLRSDCADLPIDSPDSRLVGTVLNQRYQLLNMIASGSIGSIFKATDLTNNEAVAIKIFIDTVASADAKQQIHAMAPEICAFQHLNVLSVLSVGFTADDRLYFVMPLVEGLTLSQCIDDQQSLSEDDILDIFPQVADALIKMHEEQLVYRGLKPSNIFLTPVPNNQLKVVLLDCGSARLLSGICAGALPLTTELFVSPLYMSPEQCIEKTIGAQADVYSLGCVMYEAITGTAPNAGDTFAEIIDRHINEKPLSISDYDLKHHIPQSLVRIVEKAMERDLTKRFQSMRQMKMELNRHKMGMTLRKIPPPPPPPPMEKRKPRRRSRWIKPIPMAILTLLFLLIAAAMLLSEMWLSARLAPRLPNNDAAPADNIFPTN